MPSLWITDQDGSLLSLESAGYANEKDFQKLLADNPAVLAGALDDDDTRWLLIAQELAIKAGESDTGTWKLDHLFVASDATPVLVEVKRSSDPRARREVAGQMLDYAASFASDWSADRLRNRRELEMNQLGLSSGSEMDEFLAAGGYDDQEQFWANVQTKIDAEEFRLLFVADRLSPTLIRIIEYLNRQLRATEVLGVEVGRHVGPTGTPVAYLPVVRGRSSPAGQRKAPAQRRTPEEFEQALLTHQGQHVVDAVNSLVQKTSELGGWPTVSKSEGNPALYINFRTKGASHDYWPILINPRLGKLIVKMLKMRGHPAFQDPDVREDLLARVSAATGASIEGNTDASPWVPVATLVQPGVVDEVIAVLKWVTTTANGAGAAGSEATTQT